MVGRGRKGERERKENGDRKGIGGGGGNEIKGGGLGEEEEVREGGGGLER